MNKGIGFSRTITLDWLDAAASLCIQQFSPIEIRQQLAETISDTVTGKDAKRKTIDVLSAIWVKTEQYAPAIRQEALTLFPKLISSTDRLWLHYGMTLVCYPFFRKCTTAIGQISRIEETITRNMIKERLAVEYGHLGALDRSVERVLASLTDWGTLTKTKERNIYRIPYRFFSSSEQIQNWFLKCALFAHPADGIPFDDLTHLPELYPFNISVGIDLLRNDPCFDVQKQGGGLYMVALN